MLKIILILPNTKGFLRIVGPLIMSSTVIIVKYAGFSAGLGTFNRFFSVR